MEENNSYLSLKDDLLATSLPEESRISMRDTFVNEEFTGCKPLSSVFPPKPALTSSLMTNFWIPPPVKSAEQEGCYDKGEMDIRMVWEQNANDAISNHLLDIKSQGNVKDSFVNE